LESKKSRGWKEGLIFIALGTELALFTVLGAYLGTLLDREWESSPWAMVTGLTLGAAAGFVHLFRVARRFF